MSGQQFGETSSMSISESAYNQWRNFVVHGFVNYDRVFGEHHVDAMLMGGYEEYNVSSTDLPYKDIVSGGRLTYSYDKRYVAEFPLLTRATIIMHAENVLDFFRPDRWGM